MEYEKCTVLHFTLLFRSAKYISMKVSGSCKIVDKSIFPSLIPLPFRPVLKVMSLFIFGSLGFYSLGIIFGDYWTPIVCLISSWRCYYWGVNPTSDAKFFGLYFFLGLACIEDLGVE